MKNEDARALCRLNSRFYAAHHHSFDATRQRPWPGWERVAKVLAALPAAGDRFQLCDVACGNLRFERYLAQVLHFHAWSFLAVDNSDFLLQSGMAEWPKDIAAPVACCHDVLEEWWESGKFAFPLGVEKFDAVVCFGFLHHVPGSVCRQQLVSALLSLVRPGGLVALSLWCFGRNKGMLHRAQASTQRGVERLGFSLETGDYLLGWQGDEEFLRYCHSFDDGEVDDLVEVLAARSRLVERFASDGRGDQLNEYLLLESRGASAGV